MYDLKDRGLDNSANSSSLTPPIPMGLESLEGRDGERDKSKPIG